VINGLDNDTARQVCKAMGWIPTMHKHDKAANVTYSDGFRETVSQNLEKLKADGLDKWILLIFIAAKDLWYWTGGVKTPKAELLEAKAKVAGIPLAALAKQAKEKSAKTPKPAKAPAKK
jgi:hypothetical protein